jgi:hypothetical protein
MLTQNTLETLRHLKLHGMAQALEEQRDTPNTHALAFEERIGLAGRSGAPCRGRTAATAGCCATRA